MFKFTAAIAALALASCAAAPAYAGKLISVTDETYIHPDTREILEICRKNNVDAQASMEELARKFGKTSLLYVEGLKFCLGYMYGFQTALEDTKSKDCEASRNGGDSEFCRLYSQW